MENTTEYSRRERFWLWSLSVFGFVALNMVFLWAIFFRPDMVSKTLTNPLALIFLAESFLLMGVLSYLLLKWRVLRLHWVWFVLLSLLGSMAFALPIVLLWRRRVRG